MKMRGVLLTTASFALTGAVVTNAWLQKKQFFPTVVYLTKSSPCMAVLYVQAFIFVLLIGKLMRKIFFGQLRPAETEHLIERSWYAVTDTCLAFTMFRDDFSPRFVASFTLLLFLKCFHWLAEDRVDFMERSPVITLLFKVRALSLLSLLAALDALLINSSYEVTVAKGASVQLVFGFEYAVLLTVVITILFKYILHIIDLQSENPWENKAVYMLYVELFTGFLRVVLYTFFTAIMIKIHTFPLFAVRPMYLTMRQFKKAVFDIILSRRAIRNMNTLYPDATAEELSSGDSTCIICREEMVAPQPDAPPVPQQNVTGTNKKLPCGHIFHTTCLRSWFQRQQTCPTCRLDVLQNVQIPQQTNPPPAPQPPNPPGHVPPVPGQHPFGMFPPMFPPPMVPGAHPMFQQPIQNAPPVAPSGGAPTQNGPQQTQQTGSGTSTTSTTSSMFPPPPMMIPPAMMMPPFMPPPPPPPMPPGSYAGMSQEQLRLMEGMETRAIEQRIECLRNIHSLLDAAMIQIVQYVTVVRQQSMPGFQIPTVFDPTQHTFPTAPPQSATPPTTESNAAASETQETPKEDQPGASGISKEATTPKEATPPNEGTPPPIEVKPEEAEPSTDELRRRRIAKLDSSKNLSDLDANSPKNTAD